MRAPIERMIARIDEIIEQAGHIAEEQERIAKPIGLKQKQKYAESLKNAFMAIRGLIADALPGPDPRGPVRTLLRLWGAEVKEPASNRWIDEKGGAS